MTVCESWVTDRASGRKLWQRGSVWGKFLPGPGEAMDTMQCPCVYWKRTGLKSWEKMPRLPDRLGAGVELQ